MSFDEIAIDHQPIDRGERREVRQGDAFINLMDGMADQSELDHRTVILDEAGIRGAARSRELGSSPGDLDHGVDHEVEERAARRQERLGI